MIDGLYYIYYLMNIIYIMVMYMDIGIYSCWGVGGSIRSLALGSDALILPLVRILYIPLRFGLGCGYGFLFITLFVLGVELLLRIEPRGLYPWDIFSCLHGSIYHRYQGLYLLLLYDFLY